MITVAPATTMARPTVVEAARSAASGSRAGPALGALAADVEQRVVDAHGETDEHDHRSRRVAHGNEVRDEAAGPDGRRDGGQPEQQRHGGGHQRAEREHEDQQRDRDRDQLGAVQAVVDGLIDRVAGRAAAELSHGHAGMRGAHAGDGPLQRGDVRVGVIGVAAEADDHEGGLAAGLRDRRRDRGDARQPPCPAVAGRRRRLAVWARLRAVIMMLSVAGSISPAWCRRASAAADSPVPEAALESWRVPLRPPATRQPTTSASHRTMVSLGRREAPRAAPPTSRARPLGSAAGMG